MSKCENKTTKWLRQTYNAFPVEIPEERYKPMTLMLRQKSGLTYYGNINNILMPGNSIAAEITEGSVADTDLERTDKIDITIGLSIIDGFLKALKLDKIGIDLAFKNSKFISLSFKNSLRQYVDPAALDGLFLNKKVNTEHSVWQLLQAHKNNELLLITDALLSNGFAINDETNREGGLDIDVPMIDAKVAQANAKVTFSTDKKKTISFEGTDPLTFAFTCARISLNKARQALQVEAVGVTRGSGEAASETAAPYAVDLTPDTTDTGMLPITDAP